MDRLKNKVAIITGGAAGIGEVTARLFADEGASVVIAARNEKNGARVVADIAAAKDAFGKVNIVVNNAGISYRETVVETTMETWNQTLAVNQQGVFLGMKYGIQAMAEHGEPSAIVSTASVDGLRGDSVFFAYCATKAAVEAMTKCAALYCCENHLNIRVNAVAPGYILTPMAEEDARQNGQTIEEYCAESAAMHPIGHLGKPLDIAYAYLYMVSDEAAFTTGTTLAVDGGYTCK